MAEELKKSCGLESELVYGKRWDFEVTVYGEEVFPKQKISRSPETD